MAIARQAAGTGEHEIAEAGESSHGFGLASAGHREARHFCQPARDESGYGVVAEAKPGADSGGNGDYIFQRTAEFHTDNVSVGVNPKAGIAELHLHDAG